MTVLSIASAEVERAGGRLGHGIDNARRAWTERHGLTVVLTDEHGARGVGEASPLPGYSPDDLSACGAALGRATRALPPVALDEPCAGVASVLDALGLDAQRVPAARFAVETALLDLVGQRLGRSVASLLAGGEVAGRSVALAALATGTPPEIQAAVREGLARGIRVFKLKIGLPRAFSAEREVLERLRADHGDAIALRLDANGAWNPDEARERLAQLAAIGPEFVEQPVAPWRLAKLGPVPVPIAADESLHAAHTDLDAVLRPDAIAVAVLKPTVLGGALRCRALAALARERGIDVVVSHTFDGPIALAAAAELALALGGARAAGLAPHAGLDAWPTRRLPQLAPDRLRAGDYVGLGLTGP